MAGGAGRIIDGGGDPSKARVLNGRLQVDSSGGGGGGGLVTQGTIPWVIQEPLSVDDNGGSLTVDGAVSVSNFPASQTVDDGGGSLTVDGTIAISENGSVVDATNSTTTPLVGGGNFTGTFTDLLGYSSVVSTINTDADSGTDQMIFEFSTDGVNVDDSYAFNFIADVPRRFQFPVTARFFRVNYTSRSGAPGNQTFFRLQTILHTTDVLYSIHRVEDNVATDRSAILVKAGLIAQVNGTGDFIPIQSNAGGILKVADGELKDEGDVAADPSRPVLAVRDDVLALPAGVADGDFTFFRVDDLGALWMRERAMELALSGSTNGQPIQVTGINSAGAVLIHNPGVNNTDQVWLYITNTAAANQILTLEFGGTGIGNEIDMHIGANDTVLVVAGAVIDGNNAIEAYAQVANQINVFGYARRVS